MMGIKLKFNDNKTKDEQYHLHFKHKNVQWLDGCSGLEFCDF